MALGPIRIPQLQQSMPIVDEQGRMSNEFARRLNEILGQIANLLNAIVAIPAIAAQINQLQIDVVAAQAAADAAQAAADAAAGSGGTVAREQALVTSGILPRVVVSALPTGDINILAHTRYYGDGTSVSVDAGTLTGFTLGQKIYVSYVDPDRLGGTVTYEDAMIFRTQTNDRHVVGAVEIPATGLQQGDPGPAPPGDGS